MALLHPSWRPLALSLSARATSSASCRMGKPRCCTRAVFARWAAQTAPAHLAHLDKKGASGSPGSVREVCCIAHPYPPC